VVAPAAGFGVDGPAGCLFLEEAKQTHHFGFDGGSVLEGFG
jgi:hypothetical protein